jgi:hypothetical protein
MFMKTKDEILKQAASFAKENVFQVGDETKECRAAQSHYAFLLKCAEVAETQSEPALKKAYEFNFSRIGVFEARCAMVESMPILKEEKASLISLLKKDIRPDLAKSQNKVISFVLS